MSAAQNSSPASNLSKNSNKKNQKVTFLNLAKEYQCGHDIECLIYISSHYYITDSDQICLFRTEEVNPKGFYRPAKQILKPHPDINIYRVCFPAKAFSYCHGNHIFNYISGDGEIITNSESFVLEKGEGAEDSNSMSSCSDNISIGSFDSDEVVRLRSENNLLKESLKLFVNEKTPKRYDKELTDVKSLVNLLRDEVQEYRQEIVLLRKQVTTCLQVNRDLLREKLRLERNLQQSPVSTIPPTSDDLESVSEFDPGELEMMPPFPFAK